MDRGMNLKKAQFHLFIFHPGHQPGKPDGWENETTRDDSEHENDKDDEATDVVNANTRDLGDV